MSTPVNVSDLIEMRDINGVDQMLEMIELIEALEMRKQDLLNAAALLKLQGLSDVVRSYPLKTASDLRSLGLVIDTAIDSIHEQHKEAMEPPLEPELPATPLVESNGSSASEMYEAPTMDNHVEPDGVTAMDDHVKPDEALVTDDYIEPHDIADFNTAVKKFLKYGPDNWDELMDSGGGKKYRDQKRLCQNILFDLSRYLTDYVLGLGQVGNQISGNKDMPLIGVRFNETSRYGLARIGEHPFENPRVGFLAGLVQRGMCPVRAYHEPFDVENAFSKKYISELEKEFSVGVWVRGDEGEAVYKDWDEYVYEDGDGNEYELDSKWSGFLDRQHEVYGHFTWPFGNPHSFRKIADFVMANLQCGEDCLYVPYECLDTLNALIDVELKEWADANGKTVEDSISDKRREFALFTSDQEASNYAVWEHMAIACDDDTDDRADAEAAWNALLNSVVLPEANMV